MEEVWRDIEYYVDLYQVSNLGNVKSLKKQVPVSINGRLRTYPERMLAQEWIKGYKRVNLYKNGKLKKNLVHRLVAKAFVDGCEKDLHVNHINGIPHDNRASNLEWVTIKQNAIHKTTILNKKPRGIYKTEGKWRSEIVFNQKKFGLGTYESKADAYKAYYEKHMSLRGVEPWNLNEFPTH
ncbi:NUMOD4 motif-containing HNH endonuclease [Salimicrobium jeotgali]|uniref:NUMOD4 motif-containing HNH endonuclease n=1 Tax=Salimicrobium jeotgali TaxID=1230341 RepID=UPI000C826324|nr:NUMOD4 motif-containing HNH endonuclease [Salimicrobium jeotgali]